MKILIFNWRCWKNPEAGGAEKYLYEISKGLTKKGHEITWFVSGFEGGKERAFEDDIEIIRKGDKFSVYFYAFYYYLTELRKRNFDLFVDDICGVPFFTPLYVRKPKVAIIHHLMGFKIFSKELPPFKAILGWVSERLVPLVYFFTPIITVSKSSKEELNRNFIRNVRIVPNGVDSWITKPVRIKKFSKPVVIYLGRRKEYKRLDLLIKAFEIVKRRIEDSELWLVGYGDAKVIKNGIKVFGKVDDKKKKNLLSKAWVSVSASMKEGWGITVIEANACGTPCIAYDVPGLRDSIIDGKTGFLIKEDGDVEKLAEAIIRILENGSLRRKLSKNALEWSKEFSWDKSAKEFLKVVGNTSDL